jgi:hypothetical protein
VLSVVIVGSAIFNARPSTLMPEQLPPDYEFMRKDIQHEVELVAQASPDMVRAFSQDNLDIISKDAPSNDSDCDIEIMEHDTQECWIGESVSVTPSVMGTVNFNGRAIPALIAETHITYVNQAQGKRYVGRCLLVYEAADFDFNMIRFLRASACDDARSLAVWKQQHDFKSY